MDPIIDTQPLPTRRALIVDDHHATLLGVSSLLQALDPALQVATAGSVRTAKAFVEANNFGRTDLVLVDLSLDDATGLASFEALREAAPAVRVAVMSGREEFDRMYRVYSEGGAGFVPKSLDAQRLVDALRALLGGERWFLPEVCGPLSSERRWPARYRQVVTLLAGGKTTREIARQLRIAPSTVKTYIEDMCARYAPEASGKKSVVLINAARHAGVID